MKAQRKHNRQFLLYAGVITHKIAAMTADVNDIHHPFALSFGKSAPDLRELFKNTLRVPHAKLRHMRRQDAVAADDFYILKQRVF